jgi:hypothetical protein
MRNLFLKTFLVTSAAVGALYAGGLRAQEAKLVQTNLVSDISNLATVTDPELVNPWGVSHSPRVSNQGTSTLRRHRRDECHEGADKPAGG